MGQSHKALMPRPVAVAVILIPVGILVSLVLVSLVILFSQCSATSADEVRALIARDLPIGTDAAEVMSFLKRNKAEFADKRLSNETDQFNYQVPLGTPIVEGRFDKGGFSFNCDWKIIAIFYFDSSWKLGDVSVREEGRDCL